MDTSTSFSNFITTLQLNLKLYWQQSIHLLKKIFTISSRQLKITFQALPVIFNIILQRLDKAIDRLARHPLLDTIERSYKNTKSCLLKKQQAIKKRYFIHS